MGKPVKHTATSLQTNRFLSAYITGFTLSLIFSVTAYLLVQAHVASDHLRPSHQFLMVSITLLALMQLFTQAAYFLHLWERDAPYWKRMTMIFTALVIVILVGGSIWIMNHLNYHMMGDSPEQTDTYIRQDEGISH